MIEGITILNESAVGPVGPIIAASLLFVVMLFLIVFAKSAFEQGEIISGICLILIILCAFSGIIAISFEAIDRVQQPRPIYQVTIDDSVSFNELYENYEIIDREGKIYEIRERKK